VIIVKRLEGVARREAAVYEKFVSAHARHIAPRLLAVEHQGVTGRRSTWSGFGGSIVGRGEI
jgi:hypothetical protein